MKNQNSQRKVVVILGPTASGKTGLALELCRKFKGFIISADSRQVYRFMDIGTGKAESEEELKELRLQRDKLIKLGIKEATEYPIVLNGIRHYMIDFLHPNCDYNVALYKNDVYRLLSKKDLLDCNAFLVGGTGLYIDAVCDNWLFPQGEPDYNVRKEIMEEINKKGLEYVWKKLIKLDPKCAEFVQKDNPRRVSRALEYILSTGRRFSEERKKGERVFNILKIGINFKRDVLYKRIDNRVDSRVKIGMVEEVLNLHNTHKVSWERLYQFGLEYRVIGEYLRKKNDPSKFLKSESCKRLKYSIHSFARRQLVWFRKDKEIVWISKKEEALKLVNDFLGK